MPLGEPLHGRIRSSLMILKVALLPLLKNGFEDQDPSFFNTLWDNEFSFVTSPVHSGLYALKIYTAPYPSMRTPLAVRSLPSGIHNVYFRFYLCLPDFPGANFAYCFRVGPYRGPPYYGFWVPDTWLSIRTDWLGHWYFAPRDNMVGNPLVLNNWYLVEYLVSDTSGLGVIQMKVDGNLLYNVATNITPGNLTHFGFEMYPTLLYPPHNQTFYVDDLALCSEGWIGGI